MKHKCAAAFCGQLPERQPQKADAVRVLPSPGGLAPGSARPAFICPVTFRDLPRPEQARKCTCKTNNG
ncbi:hypothetical protein [Methanolapillus africanus]|uniref:hypothetical protein n=1 Tax=Methanolapillus africanus TaxID=3028297 RepID=UPI0030B8C1CF